MHKDDALLVSAIKINDTQQIIAYAKKTQFFSHAMFCFCRAMCKGEHTNAMVTYFKHVPSEAYQRNAPMLDAAFHSAAKFNCVPILNEILKHRQATFRCVEAACKRDSLDALKCLYAQSPALKTENWRGFTVAHYAARFGSLKILQHMYNSKTELVTGAKLVNGKNLLAIAIENGYAHIVQWMLQVKLDTHLPTCTKTSIMAMLCKSTLINNEPLVQLILQEATLVVTPYVAIQYAAQKGNTALCNSLCKRFIHHYDYIKFYCQLFAHGSSVEFVKQYNSSYPQYKQKFIAAALKNSNFDIITWVVEKYNIPASMIQEQSHYIRHVHILQQVVATYKIDIVTSGVLHSAYKYRNKPLVDYLLSQPNVRALVSYKHPLFDYVTQQAAWSELRALIGTYGAPIRHSSMLFLRSFEYQPDERCLRNYCIEGIVLPARYKQISHGFVPPMCPIVFEINGVSKYRSIYMQSNPSLIMHQIARHWLPKCFSISAKKTSKDPNYIILQVYVRQVAMFKAVLPKFGDLVFLFV